jgi:hypothetical protein
MDEKFAAQVNALIPSYEPPEGGTPATHQAQCQKRGRAALVESGTGHAWARPLAISILAVGAMTGFSSLGPIGALQPTFPKPVWPLFLAVGLAARWGGARAAWLAVFATPPAMLLVAGPPDEPAKDCLLLFLALGLVVACLVKPGRRRLGDGLRHQSRSLRLAQSFD